MCRAMARKSGVVIQALKITILFAGALVFFSGSVVVYAMTDTDGDLVPDSIEMAEATDPSDSSSFLDTDEDGLSDFIDRDADNDGQEDLLEAGLFPYYDRDGDGVPAYLDDDDYDLFVGDLDRRVQLLFDPDNDGIASFQDAGVNNTSADIDGDQVPDVVEEFEGTDPADGTSFRDSDADGLPDFIDPDDDNDSIPDYIEAVSYTHLTLPTKA